MLYVIQEGKSYILKFQYDPILIDHIRNVPGRKWNPQEKYWTIPSEHLGWLLNELKGTDYENAIQIQSDEDLNKNETLDATNEIPDIDITDMDHYVQKGYSLYKHQIDFLKYAKSRATRGFILADEMGCITGDAVITVNVNGGSKKMTLEKFYRRFNNLNGRTGGNITYKIRCLHDDKGIFALNVVKNVLYSGVKPVFTVTTSDGKSVTATADHEILTTNGYVELQSLNVGDKIITNGTPVCKRCGLSENLITYKYAKFYGYCKKCMYILRDGKVNKGNSIERYVDKDGYVRLYGKSLRTHPNYKKSVGLMEHHYVMSQYIGRPIYNNEIVHHINGNKQDNRIENLQLMSVLDHNKLHSNEKQKHLWKDFSSRGNKIIVIPKESEIINIEYSGEQKTYDIVMEEPYRNFIANGVVVHNCGKTLEVLNYAMYMKKVYGYSHCLIITCINSAKYSWQADIEKHTNGMEQAYILGTRLKKNGKIRFNTTGADKVKDLRTRHMYGDVNAPELPYFLITNIESLRTKSGKKYTLVEEILDMAEHNELQMIPIDEVHKNMSPQSLQGKLILEIKKKTGNQIEWIPMTGTPIVNKPTDVYTPLKLVNGHVIKNYWLWCQQFCVFGGYGGHEIMAYKNIPLLKDMLQQNMLRRLKKDVLDLPPKIYFTEYVENTDVQQKLYLDLETDMWNHAEEILESMNPLTKMLKLRQVNGSPELVDDHIVVDDKYLNKNAKLARLLELVDEIVERGEKVVIFSNWVETLKPVYRFISAKYKTACFTGTMSDAEREKHKRVFINNPNYKVMLGTVGALGVNHTLTVANNVVFYDEPWNKATKEQCEDRCHRISATVPVNIYTLITKGTIDETVHKILTEKGDISSFIVDGQLNLRKNPELFAKLLGRT